MGVLVVNGAETGESDAGYSARAVKQGTWVINNAGRSTGTRIYAVTEDEMRQFLIHKNVPSEDVNAYNKKDLMIEYLKKWDYDNLPRIFIRGNWDGVGDVSHYNEHGEMSGFADSYKLARLVPNEVVREGGFHGWFTGISNGLYGLDKVKTAYNGYPLELTPSGQPYEPDAEIYNDNGTLKPESMTYTVLDTLGKLDEFNNGEQVYIFYQVVVQPFIKIEEGGVPSYIESCNTDTWGGYSGADGFMTGEGYVNVLKEYNRLYNSAYTAGDIRWNTAITSHWQGANYIQRAVLGKYLNSSWDNGAMDNLFISDNSTYGTQKLHLQSGNEGALGVGYQELKPITNNVVQVTSSFKLVDEHSGSQIGNTYEDIMALYVLNGKQFGTVPISSTSEEDVALALLINTAYNLDGGRQSPLLTRSTMGVGDLSYTMFLYNFAKSSNNTEWNNIFQPLTNQYNDFKVNGVTRNKDAISATDKTLFKIQGDRLKGGITVPKYLAGGISTDPFKPTVLSEALTVKVKTKKGALLKTYNLNGRYSTVYNKNAKGEIPAVYFDLDLDIKDFIIATGNNKLSNDNPLEVELLLKCGTPASIPMPVYIEIVKNTGGISRTLVGTVYTSPQQFKEGDEYLYKQAVGHSAIMSKLSTGLLSLDSDKYEIAGVSYRRNKAVSSEKIWNLGTLANFGSGNLLSDSCTFDNSWSFEKGSDGKGYFVAYPDIAIRNWKPAGDYAIVLTLNENAIPAASGDYVVEEGYLTKYYPELDSGNFATFTVRKNQYIPMTGRTSGSKSPSSDNPDMDSSITYNNVRWNGSYDEYSRTTHYNTHYYHKKQKDTKISDAGWSSWRSSGSPSTYKGSRSDTRKYEFVGTNDKGANLYQCYTRYWKDAVWEYRDTGSTMTTCSNRSCKYHGSTPSASYPYKWKRDGSRQGCVDYYTHNYTFYDPFTHDWGGFEEYGVYESENVDSLAFTKLNDNKYQSSTTYKDLTMSGINCELVFSRGTWGDKPNLASWMSISNDPALSPFNRSNLPGTRKNSGQSNGVLRLNTKQNTIKWWRDYERNMFSDRWDYSKFTVPSLPYENIRSTIYTYRVGDKATASTPHRSTSDVYNSTFYFADSDKTISFYPEVKMKYDTYQGVERETYVVGEKLRSFKPIEAVRVLHSTTGSEMVLEAPYARDANAKALDNSISGYDGVVPAGSGFALKSTTDGTITIETYHVRVKPNMATAWGLSADTSATSHNSIVNAIKSSLPTQLKLMIEGRDVRNMPSELKFNANVNITSQKVNEQKYGINYNNGSLVVTGSPTNDVRYFVENSKLEELIDSSVVLSGGDGRWYNESSNNTLEVIKHTSIIRINKPRATGLIPYNFGPKTGLFTNQYANGYRAEFYYNIVPAANFVFNGETFSIKLSNIDVLNRKFIISDNTVDDF